MARKYRTLQTRARKEKRTKRTRKKQRGGTKEAKDFFRDLQSSVLNMCNTVCCGAETQHHKI